jgi:hypothetical protein
VFDAGIDVDGSAVGGEIGVAVSTGGVERDDSVIPVEGGAGWHAVAITRRTRIMLYFIAGMVV